MFYFVFFVDVINFCVEHINSDDVKTFCLYLMNKMRRNRIEIRPCGVVNWFNLTNFCYFYMDDFIVYLNCLSCPYLGIIMSNPTIETRGLPRLARALLTFIGSFRMLRSDWLS